LQKVFDIQLSYDINQTTEQDSWNGNFYPVLLHGALEHPSSDFKSIKKSLHHMTKYIKNKSIE